MDGPYNEYVNISSVSQFPKNFDSLHAAHGVSSVSASLSLLWSSGTIFAFDFVK